MSAHKQPPGGTSDLVYKFTVNVLSGVIFLFHLIDDVVHFYVLRQPPHPQTSSSSHERT